MIRCILALAVVAGLVFGAVGGQAADVPSGPLSRQAVERVGPGLEKSLAARGLRLGAPIFVRIFKRPAELEMWVEGKDGRFRLFRTYAICTYSGRLGPKLRRGDMQAPEGFYFVPPGQLQPWSKYHLAFNLGYPNRYDRAHGRTGSALMVHGRCVSIGCYAMTDARIEEIYALADAAFRGGQPFFRVHVFPFPMTDAKLQAYAHSRWIAFWRNLKQGYDLFETHRRPPDVRVRGRTYVFGADAP